MTIRGRLLESATGKAAVLYRRTGKADVFHRATPMRQRGGSYFYAQRAGCDWNGVLQGGTAFTADTKQTEGESLPLANIHQHQIDTLERTHKLGGVAGLIVGFAKGDQLGECYWIPYIELRQFLDTKWRESLSRDWCRTVGSLIRVEGGRVLFLDYAAHPDKNAAIARVNAERLAQPVGELFSSEEETKPSRRVRELLEAPRREDWLVDSARWAKRRGIKTTGYWNKK